MKFSVLFMIRSLLFVSICLICQPTASQDFAINGASVTIPNGFQLHVPAESDDAYFHEEWLPGILFYPNGSTRAYEQLKFNYHDNKLEIVIDGGVLNVLANLLSGFLIKESETHGHFFLVFDHKDQPAYYEILSNGPKLLLSHIKLLTDAGDLNGATHIDEIRFEKQQIKIEIVEKFFVYTAGRLKPLKQNQKAIVKATGIDKTMVEEYVSKNKIDLQQRSNLADLFDFLNTI
jgi:hypothetical protein